MKVIIAGIIIKDGKVLVIQENNDYVLPHKELPEGADPKIFLKYLVADIGINIDVVAPANVSVFSDTTLITFICRYVTSTIRFSNFNVAWLDEWSLNTYNVVPEMKHEIRNFFAMQQKKIHDKQKLGAESKYGLSVDADDDLDYRDFEALSRGKY